MPDRHTRAFDQLLALVETEVRAAMIHVSDQLSREIRSDGAAGAAGRVRRIWRTYIDPLIRVLLAVYEAAVRAVARWANTSPPPGYDDLPARWQQDQAALPRQVQAYVTGMQARLARVGDDLWDAAQREITDSLAAGETPDQLNARLRRVFDASGPQLGDSRAARIARTEATIAVNTATLAAVHHLPEDARPQWKGWFAVDDDRTRTDHRRVDGTVIPVNEKFDVGGWPMDGPGDPTAPIDQIANCRCVLLYGREPDGLTGGQLTDEEVKDVRTMLQRDGLAASANPDPSSDSVEPVAWSTPGDTAIAYEDTETGDGRIFAPGALYWDADPKPLQYADEMGRGHDGAELAGAINTIDRDGRRITATGVLYPSQPAGRAVIQLLQEDAPLGVSVDLDDVDVELVDRSGNERLIASLPSATVSQLADRSWHITATTRPVMHVTADGSTGIIHSLSLTTTPAGTIHGQLLRQAASAAGITLINPADEITRMRASLGLTAAAGDPDQPDTGTVVHTESSGDYLVRITRARVRGATLVAMPAFADARITLDTGTVIAASTDTQPTRLHDVVTYVSTSPIPVDAATVAAAFGMTIRQAHNYLAYAAANGQIVRIARGLYIAAATHPETRHDLTASVSGDLDLPIVSDRDREWDGDAAASRVLRHATNTDGDVDPDILGAAFLYRDPDADPATLAAYKLGFADVVDGELRIVPRGVFAVAAALQGARGGVDIPDDDRVAIRGRVEDLYQRINEAFPDAPQVRPPWSDDEDMDELEASAWRAMQDMPPMPAEWFREPTDEELPPDSGGVHYRNGRIYGWVAQAGVPHQGFPGRRLTIDNLGKIDLTHFLRAQFRLDDGSTARVGVITMNVGHHRDGAECETAACQFDDTRTVAGIITVGINERGMWFSGAAAPWLSDWDRTVFAACQPSYHMVRHAGRWSLRAVLSVPVPGHPSRLAAATVVDRSNLALTAPAAV